MKIKKKNGMEIVVLGYVGVFGHVRATVNIRVTKGPLRVDRNALGSSVKSWL